VLSPKCRPLLEKLGLNIKIKQMDAEGPQSSAAFLPEMKYLPENPPPYSKIIANAEDGNRTARIENALNEANEEDETAQMKKRGG
jgi:hypothetical protein